MNLSEKHVKLFRRIHRKYKVSFEFLTANFNKVVRLYKYATSRHIVIKKKLRLRKNRAFIIYNHLRKDLFQMKRTKKSIKSLSWTKRVKFNRQRLRAFQMLQHETVEDEIVQHENVVEDGIAEEKDEPTKLSPEEVQQKLKEQLDILKSGKRAMSLLGSSNSERSKPPSTNASAESSQRNLPNHLKENLLPSNILKRKPHLIEDASISNIIPESTITTDKDKVNYHIAKENVATNGISTTKQSGNFLDSLISKLKCQVDLPGVSASSESNTLCRRISLGRVSLPPLPEENHFSDDETSSNSSDFHGFTELQIENRHVSSMLPTPIVNKVLGEAQHSAFVSEELENFMKENALDNFTNVEIPKRKEIEEGLVCDETPIPKMNMPAISDEHTKPRTVAEKRTILLQKQNNMKYLMLDDEHTIYRELQRRSKPLCKPNISIAKHVQNSVAPATRDCWKASAWLSTEKGKFFLQTANIDNVEYKIIGTPGNNYSKFLRKQNSMVSLKKVQSTNNCLQKCHRLSKDFKRLRIINPNKKEFKLTKKKSHIPPDLNIQTGGSMFLPDFVPKPCPLSKKCMFNQSKNLNLGPLEIYEMPKIELEVFPKIEKALDDFVRPYLKMIMPSDNISPEWSQFAVSTLVGKNKRKLRSTRISSSHERESFKFEIPFVNNEHRILVRKIFKRQEQFEKDFNYENLEFSKNIDKSDSNEVDCADMITDMINSIALGLSENSIIKEDPDINYTDIVKTNAMTIKKDNQTKDRKQPVKEKHGNHKLLSELERLSATVAIDANGTDIKECKELHCRLGCVCQSIMGQPIVKKHCRKPSCLFECGCKQNLDKIISNKDALLLRKKATAKLAKVEKDFCSTVVLSDNKTFLTNETQTERKSLKTAPKRYDNYSVELKDITDKKSDTIDHNHNDTLNKENTDTPIPLSIYSDEKTIDKYKHCSVALTKLRGLEPIQPWCMIHCLYKCFCENKATSGIPFKVEKAYDVDADIGSETVIHSPKPSYSFQKPNDKSPIKISNANSEFVGNNNHKNEDSNDMKHESTMPPKKKYYYISCLQYGSRSTIIPVGWYRYCNKQRFMKFLLKNVPSENEKHQRALECKIRDSLMAQVDEPGKSKNIADTIKAENTESITTSMHNNTVNNFNDTDTAASNSDIPQMSNIASLGSLSRSPMITTLVTTSPITRKSKKIADSKIAESNEISKTGIQNNTPNNINDVDTTVSNLEIPKILDIASVCSWNASPMITTSVTTSPMKTTSPIITTRKSKKIADTKIAEKSNEEISKTSIQNNTPNNINDVDTTVSNLEIPKILDIASVCSWNASPMIITSVTTSPMITTSVKTSPIITTRKSKKIADTKIEEKSNKEISKTSIQNNTPNNINDVDTTVSNLEIPKILENIADMTMADSSESSMVTSHNMTPNNVNDTDTIVSNFDIPKISNIASVGSLNISPMKTRKLKKLKKIADKTITESTEISMVSSHNNTPNNNINEIPKTPNITTSPMITRRKSKKMSKTIMHNNAPNSMVSSHNSTPNNVNDTDTTVSNFDTPKLSNIASVCAMNTTPMKKLPLTTRKLKKIPDKTLEKITMASIHNNTTVSNLEISKMSNIASTKRKLKKAAHRRVAKNNRITKARILNNTSNNINDTDTTVSDFDKLKISNIASIRSLNTPSMLTAPMVTAPIISSSLLTTSSAMLAPTTIPSEINQDDQSENYPKLGGLITDYTIDEAQTATDEFHNKLLLKLNLAVNKTMNSIRSIQKKNTKHIPTPVPNTLNSHQWQYFLQAYLEGLIFVWEINMNTYTIVAVTKTNIMPLVPNAISIINIKAMPNGTLSLIAKMLNAKIMNYKLHTLSVLMTGHNEYWRIIGFINSTNNYLENGCSARPTRETHPRLSEKINQLFQMLLERELQKMSEFPNKPEIFLNPITNNKKFCSPSVTATTSTLINNAEKPSTSFKDVPKTQPPSNIAIQKVPANEIESIYIPIPIVGNHRWLMLSLVPDFSHIYIPTWKNFLSYDKIRKAIIIALRTKKTVRLGQGVSDLDVYATSEYNNRIYIGPFPFNKKLDIILYQNFDGRMMLREDFERSQNIQRTTSTVGYWLYMKNDELILREEEQTSDYSSDKNINNSDNDCPIIGGEEEAGKKRKVVSFESFSNLTSANPDRREFDIITPTSSLPDELLASPDNQPVDPFNEFILFRSQKNNLVNPTESVSVPLLQDSTQTNSENRTKVNLTALGISTIKNQNIDSFNLVPVRAKPILKRRMTEYFPPPPKKSATSSLLSIISNSEINSLNLSLPSQSANVIAHKRLLNIKPLFNKPMTTTKLQQNSIKEIKGSVRLLQPASPPITSTNPNLIFSNNLPKMLSINKELVEKPMEKNQTASDTPTLLQTEEKINTINRPICNGPASYQKMPTQLSAKDIDHPSPVQCSVPSYNNKIVTESARANDSILEPEESIKSFRILKTKLPLLSVNPITATNSLNTSKSNQISTAIQIPKLQQSVAEILESSKSSTTPAVSLYSSIKDKNPMSLSVAKEIITNANISKLATQGNNHLPTDRFVVIPFIKRHNTTPIATSLPAKVFVSDAIQSTGMNSVAGITNATPTSVPSTGFVTNLRQSTVKNAAPRTINMSSLATVVPSKAFGNGLLQSTGKNIVPITSNASSTTAPIPAKLFANSVPRITNVSPVATSVPSTGFVTDVIQSTEKNTAPRTISSTAKFIPPKLFANHVTLSARRNSLAIITNASPRATSIPIVATDKIQSTGKNTIQINTNNTSSIAISGTGKTFATDPIKSLGRIMVPKTIIESSTAMPSKGFTTDVIQSAGKISVRRSTTASPIAISMQSKLVTIQSTGKNTVSRTSNVSSIPTSMPVKVFTSDAIQSTGRNSVPRTTITLSKSTTALPTATVTSSTVSLSSAISSSPTTSTGTNICKTIRTSVGGTTTSSPLKKVEAASSEKQNPKSPQNGGQSQYGFLVSTVKGLGKIPTKKMDTGFLIKIPNYNSPIKVDGIEQANEMLHKYLTARIKEFFPKDLRVSWKFLNSIDPSVNRYKLHNVQLLNKEMIITNTTILQKRVQHSGEISTSGISSKDASIQLRQSEAFQKAKKTISGMKKAESNLKTNSRKETAHVTNKTKLNHLKETVPLGGDKETKKISIPRSKLTESDVILIDDDEDFVTYD